MRKLKCCCLILSDRATEAALSEAEKERLEVERADRSLFVQDLILSTLGSTIFRTTPHADSGGEVDSLSHQILRLGQELPTSSEPVPVASGRGPGTSSVGSDEALIRDLEVISLESDDDKDS